MKTTNLGGDWFANQNDDGTLTLRNCDKGQRIDLPAEAVQALAAALANGALLQLAKEHEAAALYYARKAEANGETSAGFRLTAKMARDLIDSVEKHEPEQEKPQ